MRRPRMIGGYLAVFVGGGIGAALRHGVNRAALAQFGPAFPYGTLFVNVAGGLAMGLLAGLFLAKGGGSQELRLFLTTGVLGGFTTFSAFSLDAVTLWQRERDKRARGLCRGVGPVVDRGPGPRPCGGSVLGLS